MLLHAFLYINLLSFYVCCTYWLHFGIYSSFNQTFEFIFCSFTLHKVGNAIFYRHCTSVCKSWNMTINERIFCSFSYVHNRMEHNRTQVEKYPNARHTLTYNFILVTKGSLANRSGGNPTYSAK